MNKLKSLQIKKLLKELEFIESDFEYRNLIVSEADTAFINSILEFLGQHPELKKIYDDKVTEKINKSIENSQKNKEEVEHLDNNEVTVDIEDEFEIKEDEEKKEDKKNISHIKRLYREIVKLTHPDKVKNKKLNEIYLKATQYYDDNNKIGIYACCNELNIDYELQDEDFDLIDSQIKNYKNKINFLESTFTWKWYNCENESEKNQIMIEYIKVKIR